MREWRAWGVSALLAAGLTAAAKPPGLPARPESDGKVPPPITEEHFTPEKVLIQAPTSISDTAPSKYPLPIDRNYFNNLGDWAASFARLLEAGLSRLEMVPGSDQVP